MIDEHIQKHLGKIKTVFHEKQSEIVHIDIHVIEPNDKRPYYTLVTSGMSDLPMNAPEDCEDCRHAELMLCLPSSWPLTWDCLQKDENYWPIRCLKAAARFPHQYKTWLWENHTIPNGNPPLPFAGNTRMACILITRPVTLPENFLRLEVSPEKIIHFFAMMPLHVDERDVKLKKGSNHLSELLAEKKITELLDPQRKSVVY